MIDKMMLNQYQADAYRDSVEYRFPPDILRLDQRGYVEVWPVSMTMRLN
jgi:hypothetical protein